MVPVLKEAEWNKINEILLDIYTINNEPKVCDHFLKMIRGLIPYSQSFFIMFDENGKIIIENSGFVNISEDCRNSYIERFFELDYVNYITGDVTSIVYKDTDIMGDDTRRNTEFYQQFLKPYDMQYGCGIVFIKEEKTLGILNIFRVNELGDFSEKDLKILRIVKDHIANIIYSLRRNSKTLDGKITINPEDMSKYNLSNRESEIIQMLLDGKSNRDICDVLFISLSTVKKHVYNIFNKLGINSRTQILKMLKR
ncbi:hypothetical protein FACS1894219_03470 [Clostridia bacterium]|nr:hypothetical protein FACS1894219_03470 [Clostridia bacterium]